MRFPSLALATAVLAASVPAVAHPEHDQARAPASPAQTARGAIMRQVSQSKLPASWGSAKMIEAKARMRGGANQTVVTFRNDAEPNKARRMLFVVVANGDVVSTGHTLK